MHRTSARGGSSSTRLVRPIVPPDDRASVVVLSNTESELHGTCSAEGCPTKDSFNSHSQKPPKRAGKDEVTGHMISPFQEWFRLTPSNGASFSRGWCSRSCPQLGQAQP